VFICLQREEEDLHYGPADATAIPIIKVQNGLTFLAPAYPRCPGKEALKRVAVSLSYMMLLRN